MVHFASEVDTLVPTTNPGNIIKSFKTNRFESRPKLTKDEPATVKCTIFIRGVGMPWP